MKVLAATILLLNFVACQSKFAGKPYLLRATTKDSYAYRELRLYQDSTFEFLIDTKEATRAKLHTGRYLVKNDTLNLQYNTPALRGRVYQMVITVNRLYTPFISDGSSMQIQLNKLNSSHWLRTTCCLLL